MRTKVFNQVDAICNKIKKYNWENIEAIKEAEKKIGYEVGNKILVQLADIEGNFKDFIPLRTLFYDKLNKSFEIAKRELAKRESLKKMEDSLHRIDSVFK